MASVLFFDLSPSLCGYAYAGTDGRLEAGAFELPALGQDLGGLASALEVRVQILIDRFQPTELGYEAPILLKHDTLLDLRRIYGLGMVLEFIADRESLPCNEVDLKRIKTLMTGDHWAKKPEIVAAAVRLGVALPAKKNEGREDAADAVGGALCALNIIDPQAAAPWIAKLRHGLL